MFDDETAATIPADGKQNRRTRMNKGIAALALLCLTAFPATAKGFKGDWLEHKIAGIERDFKEDIAKIEKSDKISDAMKKLLLKQKEESKDLKIKQVKEFNELKTRQKGERDALKKAEGTADAEVSEDKKADETDKTDKPRKGKKGGKYFKKKKDFAEED